MSPFERQSAAVEHAERAHQLLADAETSWGAGAGKPALEREALRVELAGAHAAASLALSALVLPTAAAGP